MRGVSSSCDGQLRCALVSEAARYEHRLQLGSKAVYHLEAFVARAMAMYRDFLEEAAGAL